MITKFLRIVNKPRLHRLLDYVVNVVLGIVVLGLVVNFLSEPFKVFVDRHLGDSGPWVVGLALIAILGLILLLREYLSGSSAPISGPDLRQAIIEGLKKRYEQRVRNKMSPELRFEIALDLSYVSAANSVATTEDRITQRDLSIASFEQFCSDYTDRSRRMIIIGEPGSGKSLLLIRLALRMLDDLKERPGAPIPVILNIANWEPHYLGRFRQWLTDNLKVSAAEMGISESLARKMVEAHSFVWLLDGLDELERVHRRPFLEELNKEVTKIRRSRSAAETHAEVALCCRQEEFGQLEGELPVHAIVHIRPLSPQRIDNALAPLIEQGDREARALRAHLQQRPSLYQALSSPFLIQASLVLSSEPGYVIPAAEGTTAIRDAVTKDYVDLKLREMAVGFMSSERRMQQWLGWLAYSLEHRARLVVFRVVDIQASWTRAGFVYTWLLSFIATGLAYLLVLLPIYRYIALDTSDPLGWDDHKYPLAFCVVFGLINASVCAIFRIPVRVVNVERSYWHPGNLSWKLAWLVARRTVVVFVLFYLLGLYMADWEFYFPWRDLLTFFLFATALFLIEGPLAPLPVVVPVPGSGVFGRYGLYQLKRLVLRATAIILVCLGHIAVMDDQIKLTLDNLPGIFIVILGFVLMHTIYRNNLVRHYCLRILLWCLGLAPWRLMRFLEVASNTGGLLIKDGDQWRFRHQLLQRECAMRYSGWDPGPTARIGSDTP